MAFEPRHRSRPIEANRPAADRGGQLPKCLEPDIRALTWQLGLKGVLARLGARSIRTNSPAHAPDDVHLPTLEFLMRTLTEWRAPMADLQALAAAARRLDVDIAPAAERELGPAAGRFVGAFFRELADTASGLPYSVAQPTAHRASLCLRCGAWPQAEEASLSIPRASTTPDALQWLACARYRQHGLAAARPALFALAWHAPQRLAGAIAELGDELLDRDWLRFSGSCEWTGVGEAEPPAWFPSWYLLEHPIARKQLDYFDAPDTQPAEAARLLSDILDLESRGDWRKLVSARDKLRKLNEDLFDLYMARCSVQHP